MHPLLPIPNPQYGLSQKRHGLPEGYAQDSLEAEQVNALNALNEIRFNGLTHKQRFFLDSYIMHSMDGLAAAREARLVPDDESDKQANNAAARLLRKPYMVRALSAYAAWTSAKAKINAPTLIKELVPLALSNMLDYIDKKTGEVILPVDDPAKMSAIKEIRVDKVKMGRGEDSYFVEKTSLKLYDKTDAIMKFLKLIGHDAAQDQPAAQVNVQQNNTNNVSVTLQIMPVPTGQFLPAPERPESSVIERQPILGRLA